MTTRFYKFSAAVVAVAAASVPEVAAASAEAARFGAAADIVASGIGVVRDIAVVSRIVEERSFEGVLWVWAAIMAVTIMMAAIMAVTTVIQSTNIAEEPVTMVHPPTMVEAGTTGVEVESIVVARW
jgi:hypothetical protein